MRTQTENRKGLNTAFSWLWKQHLHYQMELTRTGQASQSTLSKLAEAKRCYATWTTGASQARQRRQMAYDAELTLAAQASPRPWIKPKRKRTRKTRPVPETTPLPGLEGMAGNV